MRVLEASTLVTLSLLCGLLSNHFRSDSLPILRPYHRAAPWAKVPAADVIPWLQRDEVQLVDVRTAPEFLGGHIPGAVNLSELNYDQEFRGLQQRLELAPRVVLYDSGGIPDWASRLAPRLAASGLQNLYVMQGGLPSWRAAGGPWEGNRPR